MYSQILVPTDGSAVAGRALRHAIDLADPDAATLHLVYVAPQRLDPSEIDGRSIRESLAAEGRELLADAATRAEIAGFDTAVTVLDGPPYRAILDYAAEHDVDLIVMGTHGRRGLERFLRGSHRAGGSPDRRAGVGVAGPGGPEESEEPEKSAGSEESEEAAESKKPERSREPEGAGEAEEREDEA